MIKKIVFLVCVWFSPIANADIVYTSQNIIDEFWTWAETGNSEDGDVLIKMATGLSECPAGVYLKHSTVVKSVVSAALAAYMAKKQVVFQVWDESTRFWSGSATPYCQIRAIRLPK